MMDVDDDSVRAYRACRDLLGLYDAYRATHLAQLYAIARLRRVRSATGDAAEVAKLDREAALTRQVDLVIAERSEQLWRRLLGLVGLAEDR
jgi:hypothetical protein